MIGFAQIEAAAREHGLAIVGAFHPQAADLAPDGIGTLCLLGPGGPEMWHAFDASPEAKDTAPNPLDRWSRRTIDAMAERLEAAAYYPSDGPPWHPFQRWASAGEGAVTSPVAMQASPSRGLWASYRGALGFSAKLALPARASADPCKPCPAPCLTACPVGAFTDGVYDVPRCVAHVTSDAGKACRSGCLVRRSCPAGQSVALPQAQWQFHMKAFLKANA